MTAPGERHGAPRTPLDEVIRDPARRADPHPTYHRLRAESPVLSDPSQGLHLLTRFADAERVLRDPRFSSNVSRRRLPPGAEAPEVSLVDLVADPELRNLLFLDPPDHTRLRGLVSKAFTPRTVERLRPHITEITDTVLDRAAGTGRLDVVGELGTEVPVTVICELMGVPLADRHLFRPWSERASRLLDATSLDAGELADAASGAMALGEYFDALFAERRARPGDDLVSQLLAVEEAGDVLTDIEVRSLVLLLFIAGHETTVNLIGNGTWALLRNPEQLARLRTDPDLIGPAIEELLRYDGPVHLTGRVATDELELAPGVVAREGEFVTVLLAAANRDPDQFRDPDRLDIGRADNRHLAFGHGIHYCLGAALARVEGQTAIGRLVRRFPHLEAAEIPTYRDHFVLRGLRSLHVTVG